VADDVVAVADQLGVRRFAVLGMSIGGPYALACAVQHPDRVTAVGVAASPASVPQLDPQDAKGSGSPIGSHRRLSGSTSRRRISPYCMSIGTRSSLR